MPETAQLTSMFSELASTSPTPATTCSKLDVGGAEGGTLRSPLDPGRVIQRGSRLVADDQPRLVNESPRDRHPLLLASRQSGGQCVAPPIEPELIEQRLSTLNGFRAFHSGCNQGDRRVFGGRQGWQQIELLENEADVFAAKQDPLVGWQTASVAPEQFHRAVAWIQQPGDHG